MRYNVENVIISKPRIDNNMDGIQSLQKAKFYMEMLSCSFDPTTQEYVDNPLLQKEEVKNMLKYVSSILDELISNNGEVVNVEKPLDFQVSRIDKQAIVLSNGPISLTTLMARINRQVDTRTMRKLGASKISKWLVNRGYLVNEKVSVVKEVSQLAATETAENIGIVMSEQVDKSSGEIKRRVLLTRKAQDYIVDNLENILADVSMLEDNDILDDEANSDEQQSRSLSRLGLPWTIDEEEALIEEYTQAHLTLREIAKLHDRTPNGIRLRLKSLGLLIKE